jgi:hypothetical protein
MTNNQRILLFFILPTLAPLILPLQTLLPAVGAVLAAAALTLASGYFLYKGKSLALTFTIFLQGLNFIVRMMLFFSRSVNNQGVFDVAFSLTSLLSMALSVYLLFRLDKPDIRAQLKG